MPGLRQQGVYGANLPTKKSSSVQAADFAIAGLIGRMERRFDVALPAQSAQDFAAIFGGQPDPSVYGPDAVDGFFKNLNGQPGTLFICSPPNAAAGAPGAITDTQASMALPDTMGTPQTPITVKPAYQGNAEYGVGGNRTGVQIEVGDRFSSLASADASASAVKVYLASVADFVVGDVVKMVCSKGSSPTTVYGIINEVNQSQRYVGFAVTPFSAAAYVGSGDTVSIPGFRIHTFRKDAITGIEQEVDTDLGRKWLGLNPAAPNYYPPNVFAYATFISVTVNSTTSTNDKKMPAVQATTVYPGSTVTGAVLTPATDGAAMTTSSQWARALSRFDAIPVRFLANCETTDQAIQMAGEAYCSSRTMGDNPLWVANLPEAQTKSALILLGNNWQRGTEVDAGLVGHWGLRQDPFQVSLSGAPRHVPLVGHVMGLACRGVGSKGVHASIATRDMPILGLVGISGTQFTDAKDRTDLANAGINCVEYLAGYGYVLRNWLTPSTLQEFQFANGVVMRNFIKVSSVNSLQVSENTPNAYNRISSDRTAILTFLYKMWQSGSTGNVAEGETFGQYQNADGSLSKPTDHFEVRADLVNNPLSSQQAGNRNYDVYFTYPAPAGSIKIGVGIMLRG